jgi:hypothetical protein
MESKKDAGIGNKAQWYKMMQGKQSLFGQFHVLFYTKIQ